MFLLYPLTALAMPPPALPDASVEAICRDRPGCTLVGFQEAGRAENGFRQRVAEVQLPAGEDALCTPHEHWLVVTRIDEHVRHQLLLEVCNDGYGASGVGEDRIEVGPNHFRHTRYGGSAWRWEAGTTVQLSPLQVVGTESWSGHIVSGVTERLKADLLAARWTEEWWLPACDEAEDEAYQATEPYRAVSVPLVTLDPLPSWRDTGLGSCAATVDSAAESGFAVHGGKGARDDARMAALLVSETELWVEVHDDTVVSGHGNWIYDDHIELWLGEDSGPSWCHEAMAPARQWGIGVDGRVYAGHGVPAPIQAEALRTADGTLRWRITLPEPVQRITLAYSDSDVPPPPPPPKKRPRRGDPAPDHPAPQQERIIATSDLEFGVLATLGRAARVPGTVATCAVREGNLALVDSTDPLRFEPNRAVIDGY